MDALHERNVPEWLNDVDSLMRCPICDGTNFEISHRFTHHNPTDFYRNPVMLGGCGHTYCSQCIRRALAFKDKCPECSAGTAASALIVNRRLAELSEAYKVMMKVDGLYAHTQLQLPETKRDVQVAGDRVEEILAPQEKAAKDEQEQAPIPETDTIPAGHVKCPVCSQVIKEKGINNHLDKCLNGIPSSANSKKSINSFFDSMASQQRARTSTHTSTSTSIPSKMKGNGGMSTGMGIGTHHNPISIEQDHPTKKLPILVYNIMRPEKIRAELAKHGLRTDGAKDKMVWRHEEYVLRHNAEVDAVVNPKTFAQIRAEVEEAESSRQGKWKQKGHGNVGVGVSRSDSKPKLDNDLFESLISDIDSRRRSSFPTTSSQTKSKGKSEHGDGNDKRLAVVCPHPWRAVYSDIAKKVFYYNPVLNMGQFDPPEPLEAAATKVRKQKQKQTEYPMYIDMGMGIDEDEVVELKVKEDVDVKDKEMEDFVDDDEFQSAPVTPSTRKRKGNRGRKAKVVTVTVAAKKASESESPSKMRRSKRRKR